MTNDQSLVYSVWIECRICHGRLGTLEYRNESDKDYQLLTEIPALAHLIAAYHTECRNKLIADELTSEAQKLGMYERKTRG